MAAVAQPTPDEPRQGTTDRPLAVVAADDPDAIQHAAEHTMLRGVVIGTTVGMVLGALVWAALVAVALAGGGYALAGPVWMGAAVGVFAGAFLGGWAGIVATTATLERAEHHTRARVH
ncbi:MAG TPA: hypothetical protein VF152_14280 [Acidimicrobiia bacterium]